jgi:hypothetical protein
VSTVEQVCAVARARYGQVRVAQLAAVYAELPDADPEVARRVGLVTVPVAFASVRAPLAEAIGQVGPRPADVLRVTVYDPHCGVGMFLVIGAYQLADAYAGRLTASRRRAERLARRLLPEVMLHCVYGMDTDPLAVELARLALSVHTDGRLTPAALERNVVCGDPAAGDVPPAKRDRTGTVDLIPAVRQAR